MLSDNIVGYYNTHTSIIEYLVYLYNRLRSLSLRKSYNPFFFGLIGLIKNCASADKNEQRKPFILFNDMKIGRIFW